jgi:hypothetical protein
VIERGRALRTIAGVAVLLILLAIGVLLIPPYIQNWKLQRYVNGLVDDPATAGQSSEIIRDEVVSRGAALGLPLHAGDVQVTRPQSRIRIDALYIVHVDYAGYSVDLHFRPAAGGN